MQYCFSDDFLKILESSLDEAIRTGWHNICPDHIMLAILRHSDNDACRALRDAGLDPSFLKSRIDDSIFVPEQIPWSEREKLNFCESARSMLSHASVEAARCHSAKITPLHYLLAVCRMAGCYSHDILDEERAGLPELLKAAGIEGYGLAPAAAEQEKSAAPDPQVLAAEIEKRIREGYSVNSPITS